MPESHHEDRRDSQLAEQRAGAAHLVEQVAEVAGQTRTLPQGACIASVQSAEQSAGANANAAVASAPKSPDSDDADQTANADWGTAQDYQNQGEVTGPMISSAVPFGAGTLPNEAYVRPPIFVAAPVPIGPFVGTAGPLLPRAIVARGPIRGFHFRRFR